MSRPSKTAGRPQAQRSPRTKAQTQQVINRAPKRASDWKALGNRLLQEKQYAEARHALEQARTLDPRDAEALILLGMVEIKLGDIRTAQDLANKSLEIDPNNPDGLCLLGRILYDCGLYDQALGHIEQALALVPGREDALERKALIFSKTHRYEEAIALFDGLIRRRPDYFAFWNNAANLLKDIGQLDKAEVYYLKAIELSGSSPLAYSNRLTSLHYNPTVNRERIFGVCKEWETRYAPKDIPPRPQPEECSPQRRLRIGMISDGFSNHPVGRMITLMLESLPRQEFELFAYSTSNFEDSLTRRIKQSVGHWAGISHLTDEQFAERVRSEKIDILIDLAGHNSGNRMRTMALQPAPLLVKWVGGLINTTGLSAIDYLLSDSIESPPGEDEFYTEKLIRLPDDYICFTPPEYVPEIGRLPALNNGYITLGCFNNPTKINEVVLGEWAKIMHALPGSRLLLKGMQYNSEDLCKKVRTIMAAQGIEPERLMIEGPSPHRELLQTYNRVDISLDPWPYSGGLTTCEAFLMGVPVVSRPGPTFAGRHSATHLVNAGMPELVVDSWDEYRERVLELASDLDSLSTIRHHLREVLLQSPVCDGPRFAKNFTIAMRAIWQRYCEGKQPAALTLTHEGQAWFEGDSEPVELQHPLPPGGEERDAFDFTFEGKVVTLDNGALLVGTTGFGSLQRLGVFATIAFDPMSKVTNAAQLQAAGELHHYPHVSLGNGGEGTLYACLDPAMSGTLEPLPADRQLPGNQEATQVIAKLPITTLRLDDIEGLDNIDWLLLDNMNDSLTILENGEKTVAEALLVQVRVNFSPTHKKQPELTQISHWLARHGFSFYRLNNLQHYSHLPERDDLLKQQATQLVSADAIFIPSSHRLEQLEPQKKAKLAFILHAVYQMHDLAFSLIAQNDTGEGEKYLEDNSYLNKSNQPFGSKQPHRVYINHGHPKACVGVPVYNEEKYIQETILSLKKQDVDGVKFVIYDNASSDHTYEMARELSSDDARFELARHPQNLGAADNFIKLFKESDSDYFMWLGGHDYLSENYINEVINILNQDDGVSMACGLPFGIMNGRFFGPMQAALYDFTQQSPAERYIKSVSELANCTVFHSLFRRKDLEGFEFRKTISFDHVLISRLLWKGRLEYTRSARYYRRFFEKRKENQEERILGRDEKIDRKDFFDFYNSDLKLLLESGKNKNLTAITGKLQAILKKRFPN